MERLTTQPGLKATCGACEKWRQIWSKAFWWEGRFDISERFAVGHVLRCTYLCSDKCARKFKAAIPRSRNQGITV